MFKCRIAGLVVEFHNRYDFVHNSCRDYFCDENEKSDIILFLTEEEIKKEANEEETRLPILEYTAFYRKLCEKVIDFDGFLLHGAAIELDGDGYVFCAESGTGKTTHIGYWVKLFGDKVSVVNGDKPIIRCIEGNPIVYGTPWCGKEKLNKNTSVPLRNLCFIHRAKENSVEKISSDEALKQLMGQILLLDSPLAMMQFLGLVDILVTKCEKYNIYCNMSIDAARVAYDKINKGETK